MNSEQLMMQFLSAEDIGREMEQYYNDIMGPSPLPELTVHELLSKLFEFKIAKGNHSDK